VKNKNILKKNIRPQGTQEHKNVDKRTGNSPVGRDKSLRDKSPVGRDKSLRDKSPVGRDKLAEKNGVCKWIWKGYN
jgi:hypothetical protein